MQFIRRHCFAQHGYKPCPWIGGSSTNALCTTSGAVNIMGLADNSKFKQIKNALPIFISNLKRYLWRKLAFDIRNLPWCISRHQIKPAFWPCPGYKYPPIREDSAYIWRGLVGADVFNGVEGIERSFLPKNRAVMPMGMFNPGRNGRGWKI